jgi:hypothetical protein
MVGDSWRGTAQDHLRSGLVAARALEYNRCAPAAFRQTGHARWEAHPMPKFMDVHHGMHGVTPEALQAAHQADLDIQGEEDVDFQRAWGDPDSGMVWCLSEAPSAEAVKRIHERAGHPATEVYPVPVEV